MTKLCHIVACAKDGVIGKNGTMPWHIPEDLKHFKSVTMGAPVIMGRKTHESIGRALPGRLNIIVTRQMNFQAPGCTIANTIEDALKAVGDAPKAFIIGGAEIYRATQALVDEIWLTEIDLQTEGDAFYDIAQTDCWNREILQKLEATETRPALIFSRLYRKEF